VPAGFRFPRERRLRKRREYLLVQGRGRRVSGKHFQFFVLRRAERAVPSRQVAVAAAARFGITVTRKVGNAVVRNRIKRIVREGCRRAPDLFPAGTDLVILARPSAAGAGLSDVTRELVELARRLGAGGSQR